MASVNGHLVQAWNYPINAEGLVSQLTGRYYGIDRCGVGGFGLVQSQVLGGEVSVLAVWRGALIPGSIGFVDDLHQGTVLVVGQDLVVFTGTVAQTEGAAAHRGGRDVRVNAPDLAALGGCCRRMEVDIGRHGGGDRGAHDAAFYQPLPFARVIDRVLDLQLVFPVQRLCDNR